jgi:hypothetical protein
MSEVALVTGKISSTAKWRDITAAGAPTGAVEGGRQLKIGTVAVIDHEDAQSTYAFNSLLTFELDTPHGEPGGSFAISSCSGHGTCLDGMDRGSVRYRNVAPWTATLDAEGSFDLRGEVTWTDRFNEEVGIPLRLRGRVREDGGIEGLQTSLEGVADYDPGASEALLMEVPAVW